MHVGCHKGLTKNYNKLDLTSLRFCACTLLGKIVTFQSLTFVKITICNCSLEMNIKCFISFEARSLLPGSAFEITLNSSFLLLKKEHCCCMIIIFFDYSHYEDVPNVFYNIGWFKSVFLEVTSRYIELYKQ